MAKKQQKAPRVRSPNYPAISLPDALRKVTALYEKDGRAGAPFDVALRHFGFGGAHGVSRTVVAALKSFGLIDVINNRIVPTPLAINILEFPAGHSRAQEAIKAAALKPEIFKDILDQYRHAGHLPSDDSLGPELITDFGFNRAKVAAFLVDFRASLEFAGLLHGNALVLSPGIAASLESAAPKTIVEQVDPITMQAEVLKPQAVIASTVASRDIPRHQDIVENPPSPTPGGMRRDIFTLDEGQAILQWPERISAESVEEIKEWFALLIKKATRQASKTEPANADLRKLLEKHGMVGGIGDELPMSPDMPFDPK